MGIVCRRFSWNIMPYLLFLKKRQNFKLLSAANYRWGFKGLFFACLEFLLRFFVTYWFFLQNERPIFYSRIPSEHVSNILDPDQAQVWAWSGREHTQLCKGYRSAEKSKRSGHVTTILYVSALVIIKVGVQCNWHDFGGINYSQIS